MKNDKPISTKIFYPMSIVEGQIAMLQEALQHAKIANQHSQCGKTTSKVHQQIMA